MQADRLPPQHLEAEMGCIGSCMLDNTIIDEIMEKLNLQPGEFYRDAHQHAWTHVLKLWNTASPVDAISMADSMKRAKIFKQFGGDDFLTALVTAVPHGANGVYYAGIIRQKAITRSLMETAMEIMNNGYSNEFTAEQLLESAERRIFEINARHVASTTMTAGEVIGQSLEMNRRRAGGEVVGITTQFGDLDQWTGGFQDGQVTILAARPGQGKSALALNIAEHVAFGGRGVLFVSLEMPASELGDRLLCGRAPVDGYAFKAIGGLGQKDSIKIARAAGELEPIPLFIDDNPSRTTGQIAANARRLKKKHDISLIVIDYLGLIDAQGTKNENRQEQVAGISRRLKTMARALKIPVIALHQLSRDIEKREDPRPRMSDIRDSGQIEADAHLILLLNRPETKDENDQPGIADVFIAKNRNGQSYVNVKLCFEQSYTRFSSLAKTREPGRGRDDSPAF
jgi:replicative DNA helicase